MMPRSKIRELQEQLEKGLKGIPVVGPAAKRSAESRERVEDPDAWKKNYDSDGDPDPTPSPKKKGTTNPVKK